MKTYKVHFVDGKTFKVTTEEKLTQKKLSSKFLTFMSISENTSKIFLNSDNVLLIEEVKEDKKDVEKKSISKKKERKVKADDIEHKTVEGTINNPKLT